MKLLRQLRALFRKEKLDAEMSEEMRHHLDAQTRRNLAAGMSLEEARYAARRSFGGVEQIKERAREERRWMWLDQLIQDVRLGVRALGKNPRFTLVAVLTLALGIGATTAIFSVAYAVVLRPLPFPESERLVAIWTQSPQADRLGMAAAKWGIALMLPWLPATLPRLEEIQINLPVLLFSGAMLIVTAALVLWLPACSRRAPICDRRSVTTRARRPAARARRRCAARSSWARSRSRSCCSRARVS